jgi:transposase-like protein
VDIYLRLLSASAQCRRRNSSAGRRNSSAGRRNVFPRDKLTRMVIYFAITPASKIWTTPIQNWSMALSRFLVAFGDRLPDHQ